MAFLLLDTFSIYIQVQFRLVTGGSAVHIHLLDRGTTVHLHGLMADTACQGHVVTVHLVVANSVGTEDGGTMIPRIVTAIISFQICLPLLDHLDVTT